MDLIALQGALRRIAHATELHSRRIDRDLGLTLPQLSVLCCIRDLGEVTSRSIARAAHISPATVVVILDRLEAKGMIRRERSLLDRRVVHARMTEAGIALLDRTGPQPFSADFITRLAALPEAEQRALHAAVAQVAALMDPTEAGFPSAVLTDCA